MMTMVLARPRITTPSELRYEPVARQSRRKMESVKLTMREQATQEHKHIAVTLRREAMIYLGASAATLLFPLPSEAKPSRIEMKKKVMEKLRQLRERAGRPEESKENSSTKKVDEGRAETPFEAPNNNLAYPIEGPQLP